MRTRECTGNTPDIRSTTRSPRRPELILASLAAKPGVGRSGTQGTENRLKEEKTGKWDQSPFIGHRLGIKSYLLPALKNCFEKGLLSARESGRLKQLLSAVHLWPGVCYQLGGDSRLPGDSDCLGSRSGSLEKQQQQQRRRHQGEGEN